MSPTEQWTPPAGFSLVYKGGHHNIYCDGKKHRRTTGGTVGHSVRPHPRWKLFSCDCEKWK